MRELGLRNAPQARLQRGPVARIAREQLDLGLHAVLLRDRRRQRAALGQQRGKPQDLFPVLRAALGAQLHAGGGDMARSGAVHAAQRIACADEIALVQRKLGLRQQPSRMQRLARRRRALQPLPAALVFAHLVRGACGDQGCDAGRCAGLPGKRRLLLGAGVASLEITLQRARQRQLGLLAPPPLPERAHLRRQRERMAEQARHQVREAERRRQREQRKDQRKFDPPGRIDDQHVAFAEAAGERERHRSGEHRHQPEQRPHQPLLKAGPARGAP